MDLDRFTAGIDTTRLLSLAALGAVLAVLGLLLSSMRQIPLPTYAPKLSKDTWPIVGAFRFFTARYDFVQDNKRASPSGAFSYFLGRYPVVCLTSKEDRQLYFEHRNMNFDEGYAVLFGLSPTLEDFGSEISSSDPPDTKKTSMSIFAAKMHGRLLRALRPENVARHYPGMIQDLSSMMDDLAVSAPTATNPFDSVYAIVFRATVRMLVCADFAQDPKTAIAISGLLDLVERSTTASTIITPWWLPTLARAKRTWAGVRLYTMVGNLAERRRKAGVRADDTLQMLLDAGDDINFIIRYVMNTLFAAKHNSSLNAAYLLCHLGAEPGLLARVRGELAALAKRYAPDPNAPFEEQLLAVPPAAWDSELPLLDACLKETIRLSLSGCAFRWNSSGNALPLAGGHGEAIPPGAFVTFPFADIHRDPDVYDSPDKWDPPRFLEPRNEASGRLEYLGWGTGRHVCLGMKFAKFEIFLATALFINRFDFELVNESGRAMNDVYPYDLNAPSAVRPKQPMLLKYSKRETGAKA